MLDKFNKIYQSIIFEQDYTNQNIEQKYKNSKAFQEWDDQYVPPQNMDPEQWFEDRFGFKVSANTYIIMSLTVFYAQIEEYFFNTFMKRLKDLIDDGATIFVPYVSNGQSMEYEVVITIQQLYKFYDHFNSYYLNSTAVQLNNIIKGKDFYNSADEAINHYLNYFDKDRKTIATTKPIDVFQDILKSLQTEDWGYFGEEERPQLINSIKSSIKKYFNINM